MSDIFAGTEPPAWLTRMTTGTQPGMLGHIFGELVAGLANSAETAIDKAHSKQAQGIDTSWIKELPGSFKPGFAEARLNAQNPLWKMQAQQAQLNMAQQAIGIQSQQSLIESRKTKLQMQQHDQEVLPAWLQSHPTWESRQDAEPPTLFTTEATKMFRDIQLGDAGNVKHKAIVDGISAYTKSVAELQKIDPIAAAPFATQIGRVPTPDLQTKLEAALGKAKDKAKADAAPAPMDIEVGGKIVHGIVTKGVFKEIKAPKTPEPKVPPALKDELMHARHELEGIEKAMADPSNYRRMGELQQEKNNATKYYRRLLQDTEKATGAAAPDTTKASPPVPAPAPQAIDFSDFQKWKDQQ